MDIDISIKEFREFVSENPYEEIWRQLYYFTDVDSVNEKIRKRFNIKDGLCKSYTKNQAQEIPYSIIQAHNYFKSASQVDISVKPNLIYYGISSLANALILFNFTDTQILYNDETEIRNLLKKEKEAHHGLDPNFSFKNLGKDIPLQDILKSISCEIYKKSSSGEPYGHFKNFYNSIVHEFFSLERKTNFLENLKNIASLTWTTTVETNINKRKIKDLTEQKFDLLSMFRFLPDTVPYLIGNGIESNLCPGTIRSSINKINTDQEELIMGSNVMFAIDGVSSEKKDYFKRIYQGKNAKIQNEFPMNFIFVYDIIDKGSPLVISYDIKQEPEEPEKPFELDVVQDISGRHYFIYNVEEYIQELANLYICFFCTGMLCRYYPDYWMYWIEKNVGFKHLMETLCSIAIRKFPNLILNQLTQCINYFHL